MLRDTDFPLENDGLFYMIHGDVTYTDEALYENKKWHGLQTH